MTRKKIFCKTSTNRLYNLCRRLKQKHEFDVSYKQVYSDRINRKKFIKFDDILSKESLKIINTSCLVNKISEETGLPERVIGATLLTFIDCLYIAIQKNKTISIHDFGVFYKDELGIKFKQAKNFINFIKKESLCDGD